LAENVWITQLAPAADGLRLAVKDNIDVAGVPTTAACPAFAYTPDRSAPVVQRLVDAGLVVVGKTNMDQFATGLTGTRSPYGVVRSALDPDRISGGSSSGSAVAVAAGLADVALGTDTAGSGRVPAACNGVVGLKPTPGLLPIDGIVPACRSIDCPSVFTRTVAEARSMFDLLAPSAARATSAPTRLAIPSERDLAILPPAARAAFETTARSLGLELVEIDMALFFTAGDLLYDGAWLAERYASVGAFIEAHPEEVHPVVASIILRAKTMTAADAFRDRYRLVELVAAVDAALAGADALLVPTVTDVPTVDAALAEPYDVNRALGRWTTFGNLLGLAAVSTPGRPRADGVPAGVTVMTRGGAEHLALDVASLVEGEPAPPAAQAGGRVHLAVVGAHLEGQPLHHQLADRGAQLVARTATAPRYRLFALATEPAKPGLVRVASGGAPIEVEVWALDEAAFGSFVAAVPSPLAVGKLELADGTWVPGFVCEPTALDGAPDITAYGGWRAWLAAGQR
jgi:allophanate hydrolase